MELEGLSTGNARDVAGLGCLPSRAAWDSRLDSAAHIDLQRAFLAARHPFPADPDACRSRLTLLSELAFSTVARRA